MVTFELPLTESFRWLLRWRSFAKQGYQRCSSRPDRQAGRVCFPRHPSLVTRHFFDRHSGPASATAANRARVRRGFEQAYHFGKGKLAIRPVISADSDPQLSTSLSTFSNRRIARSATSNIGAVPCPVQFLIIRWGLPGLPWIWPGDQH